MLVTIPQPSNPLFGVARLKVEWSNEEFVLYIELNGNKNGRCPIFLVQALHPNNLR